MFWLNSDLMGLVLGLLVFLVMAFIGWITHVPFWTNAQRALLGLVIGYVIGWFVSSRIRKAVTVTMVKDRLERARRVSERMAAEEGESGSIGETHEEDEFAAPR